MTEPDAVDHILPDASWTFDASVAQVFDNMLERSIPQYDVMRSTVAQVASSFAERHSAPVIVDLGCSRGESLASLVTRLGQHARFVGVETAAAMLEEARRLFAGDPRVEIVDLDLRHEYPEAQASVTLSVLTLQFVPIEHRQHLLQSIFDHTLPGGSLILVEKVLGATATLDALMVDAHLAMKRRNGYSAEEIDRKRLSLEGVLVPVTARWNEELLRSAGFVAIDCFWRWMNFAGWIAVRH
jgi:tRNA (cmo5U34)-methyltransferase